MSDTVTTNGWTATLVEAGILPMAGRMLAPAGQLPEHLDVPSNVLVLRGHGRTILVDTAAGNRSSEWDGAEEDLNGALEAAGVDISAVDTVILTHLDFDHAGGVEIDGEPAFGGARVVVSRAAAKWAESSQELSAQAVQTMAREHLLDVVDPGQEIAHGIRLADAPGHRVGHCLVDIAGGAAYLADVIHHPSHVANLSWDREFDSDPELALETRTRILAATAGIPVACSHIAGWGRIEPAAEGLVWQPA